MLASSSITKRPFFWVAFVLASLSASVIVYHYFPRAFSILNISVDMNREEALQKARELAEMHKWGPCGYDQTAIFQTDSETKNFIELEGGGKEKLNSVLHNDLFPIYSWTVRHYKEHNAHDLYIGFTPSGKLYGFDERLPENEPGAALSKQEAQKIAETTTQRDWHISLSNYTLAESSSETKPNGRIDHTFIYEYKEEIIKDAPLRLHIKVSGDKCTHFEHKLRIPEAFKRRYEQMRSFNNTLARVALLLIVLFYLLGGCIIGLFFLTRSRSALWKQAFIASGILSILTLLSTLNSFPSLWIGYDTAISKATIYTNFLLSLIQSWAVVFAGFGIIFAAAEGLSRLAFADHPQLWKVWARGAAGSLQIAGRTISGYLIVAIDLCICVMFYFFMDRYFNWWSPSSTLIDPNILATYMPSITAISESLNAGFMEECLFRAIPLASAQLLGKRFGKKNLWVISTLLLQAFIFGAAHANYPAQPFYARLVELIIPSLIFGLLYLFYGLLPAIVSHVIYDLVWFSLPIFLSTDRSGTIQQVIVIIAGAVPLLIVFINRIRNQSWQNLSSNYLNRSWKVTEVHHHSLPEPEVTIDQTQPSTNFILPLALAALLSWGFTTSFKQDTLPLTLSKSQAQEIFKNLWQKQSVDLSAPWVTITIAQSLSNSEKIFMWRQHKALYEKLLGTYISPAQWIARSVNFEGNIIDRAEEYWTAIQQDGVTTYRKHTIPESWEGPHLSEQEARAKVHAILQQELHHDIANLEEVSAISEKLPGRTAWNFIFKDIQAWPSSSEQEGQARIKIKLSGDQVAEYQQYIFVPEEWERTHRQEQHVLALLTMMCGFIILLLYFVGISYGIKQLLHGSFNVKIFSIISLFFIIKSGFQIINLHDLYIFGIKTSEPYGHQLFAILSSLILSSAGQGLSYAFFITVIKKLPSHTYRIYSRLTGILLGISLGVIASSTLSILKYLLPSINPVIIPVSYATALYPVIAQNLASLTAFISETIRYMLIFNGIEYVHYQWSIPALTIVCSISMGIANIGSFGIEALGNWIILGSVSGLLYWLFYTYFIRFDRALIPYMMCSSFTLSVIQQAIINSWPGMQLAAFVSICCAWIISAWWSESLRKI